MNKAGQLISCATFIILATACSSSERRLETQNTNQPIQEQPIPSPVLTTEPPQLPPLSDGVILRLLVSADATLRPTVIGETNLPDSTTGIVTLESQTSNFTGQDRFTVQGGHFRAGPFGTANSLALGQYIANATVSIAQVQSPEVRAVIGERGENLRGSLVRRGRLGTIVEAEVSFQLSGGGTITIGSDNVQVEASIGDARTLLQALRTLEQQGRSMETLRQGYPEDLAKVRQCGEMMRERQPEADRLRARAEALPGRYSLNLLRDKENPYSASSGSKQTRQSGCKRQ